MERVVEILQQIEAVHSPSGYTREVIQQIAGMAEQAGIKAVITNKGGLLAGNHPAPDLVVSGHVDTLGAMVSGVNSDGSLAITKIGGPLLPSFEAEYATIMTADGKEYRGTLLLNNPAAHVNREAGTAERKPENMHIRLDAETAKKEETESWASRSATSCASTHGSSIPTPVTSSPVFWTTRPARPP